MRLAVLLLAVLVLILQIKLWVGEGGLGDVHRLGKQIEQQQQINQKLRERNQALEGEVKDLKQGLESIEERARSELGMIKDGETFYQVIDENNKE